MVAAPARTTPRRALWQQLRRCEACGNGTLPYLPLYPVRIDVSNHLEPAWGHHGRPLHSYPRSYHCSGTRYAMMARSQQGPSRRPPTLRRGTPRFPMLLNSAAYMEFVLSLAYKSKTNSPAAEDTTQGRTTYDTSRTCSPILPQYLQPLHQGLGGHASSPALLVAAPLQAPRC
jgi:hypothetical protein